MKAISLWQPWATLIAAGVKPYETRHWAPPAALIGKPIAIHAAKKVDRDAVAFAEDLTYGQHEPGGYELADKIDATMASTPDELLAPFGQTVMPVGCVVCIARLEGAFQIRDLVWPEGASHAVALIGERRTPDGPLMHIGEFDTDDFGDYSPGRWAWRFSDARPLKPPVAMRGRQGFFNTPQGWLA